MKQPENTITHLDPLANLMTYEQIEAHRPDLFTVQRVKFLIRNRSDNGLADANALVKVGKSFRVKYEQFASWYLGYIENVA